MCKRVLSLVLTICLVFCCFPVAGVAFATESAESGTAKFSVTSSNYNTLEEQNGWSVSFSKNANGGTKAIPTGWYSGEVLTTKADTTSTWAMTQNGVTGTFSDKGNNSYPHINAFDGNLGSKADYGNNNGMISESGSSYTNSYAFDGNYQNTFDFVVELSNVADISGFLLSSYSKYSTGAYRIYASNNRETLFSGEPVIDYQSSSQLEETVAHVYKLNEAKTLNARYIGLRVAAVQAEGYVGGGTYLYCLRLSEFAVFGHVHSKSGEGEVVAPDCENDGYTEYLCADCGDTYHDNVVPALGHTIETKVHSNNQLADKCSVCGKTEIRNITTAEFNATPDNYKTLAPDNGWNISFSANTNGGTAPISTSWYSGDVLTTKDTTAISWYATANGVRSASKTLSNKLTFDGTTGTKSDFGNAAMSVASGSTYTNAYNFDGNYQNTIDFVFDLGTYAEISGLLVATYGTYSTGAYSVYISDDLLNVFDGTPVLTYESSTVQISDTAAHIFKIDEANRFKTRFIGIRVAAIQPKGYTNTATYTNSLRLSEIALFGTLDEMEYRVAGGTLTPLQYAESVAIADSIIADKDPVLKEYTNTTLPEDSYKYSAGDKEANLYISTNSIAASLGYKPTDSKNINKAGNVLIANNGQVNFAYQDENGNWAVYQDADKMSVRLGYYLGGPTKVEEVSNYFHFNANGTTYKYRLSFANSVDDLFEDSAVYNTDIITNYVYNYNLSVKFNKEIIAKYIGIEIISGVTPNNPSSYGVEQSYARMTHIDVFGAPADDTKTITVVNESGDVVYKTWTNDGYIDADAQAEITKSIPTIFGYKYFGLDKDLTEPFDEDTQINILYKRDTSLSYGVTYVPCDAEVGETTQMSFDSRCTISDENATTFKVDDAVIGVPGNATLYVGGDLTIKGTRDAAPATPVISILNYYTESQTLRTFAHAYVPEGFTVNKIGTVVVTGTVNDLFTDSDWTVESLHAKNKKFINEYLYKDGRDFMFTLQGINAGVRRYAKSYIEYTNGNTTGIAYSNVVLYSSVAD